MKNYVFTCVFLYLLAAQTVHAMQEAFTQIYHTNLWGDPESISGSGSSLKQTAVIRNEIPKLLKNLQVKVLLDAPCGDFNWMKETDLTMLEYYIGVDIVEPIIKKNKEKYGNATRSFYLLDVVEDAVPQVDLIICRDCLVHLRFDDIKKVLRNFKKSNSTYLLMTTFTKPRKNGNFNHIVDWRPLNFELPPFNFPKPILLINEKCSEFGGAYSDKSLGLWLLKDINI